MCRMALRKRSRAAWNEGGKTPRRRDWNKPSLLPSLHLSVFSLGPRFATEGYQTPSMSATASVVSSPAGQETKILERAVENQLYEAKDGVCSTSTARERYSYNI